MIKLINISKNYGGVKALENINIEFKEGEIHSLVGENGAGKSTLIKIITGAIQPSSGEIIFQNKKLKDNNPKKSQEIGIKAVYQELNLIPQLKVYENIFYGNEIKKNLSLDKKTMKEISEQIIKELGVNIKPEEIVANLGIGNSQIIEIAKSLSKEAKVLILDEPTASLTEEETKKMHKIIKNLKSKGIAIIYISHKLEDLIQISDHISVLRDGKLIQTTPSNISTDQIINAMLGNNLEKNSENKIGKILEENQKNPVLELKNLTTSKIENINLKLYKGEILSLSGLLGSGRTEVLDAIFGKDKVQKGEIIIHQKTLKIKSPKDAINAKIGYITEDRKDTGLFMNLSIRENVSISFLKQFQGRLFINKKKEDIKIENTLALLQTKYENLKQKSKELSGGNQQKLAMSKWLMEDLDIILLDEPTRGVDVGAKEEVYKIINSLAKSGKAILMVSSESEEIIRLSDKTLVMSKGKIISSYKKGEIIPKKIFADSSNNLKGRDINE